LAHILATILGSDPVKFVGSQHEMDRDETVKLLFLGIPALVLSLSLFTSAFRVGDMLVWYFREIKVNQKLLIYLINFQKYVLEGSNIQSTTKIDKSISF